MPESAAWTLLVRVAIKTAQGVGFIRFALDKGFEDKQLESAF
jgi:hypothetical protein